MGRCAQRLRLGRRTQGQRALSAFLVDTSFLITLVDDTRPHHADAMSYLREAVRRGSTLYLSAVVVSEFHAKQPITDLPLRNFQVLPFNIDHAMMAGELVNTLRRDPGDPRDAVKDDVKLLAQAICTAIPFVLTEDERTLAKFARQLQSAGRTAVTAVLLRDGFDMAWFDGGQARLPGA